MNNCENWQRARFKCGYGMRWSEGKVKYAHRVAWEQHYGPIPDGLCVLHKCDNRLCVNPEHLFLGTKADNVADMDAKGRRRMPKGEAHPRARLTEKDVLEIRALRGALLQQELAELYGIHQGTVSQIQNGRRWKESGQGE